MENLLITSAWVWGVYALFNHLFLNDVGTFMKRIIGEKLCKPLFCCVCCMSSVHGIPFGIYFFGLDWKVLIFIICLTGIQHVVSTFLAFFEKDEEETSP